MYYLLYENKGTPCLISQSKRLSEIHILYDRENDKNKGKAHLKIIQAHSYAEALNIFEIMLPHIQGNLFNENTNL